MERQHRAEHEDWLRALVTGDAEFQGTSSEELERELAQCPLCASELAELRSLMHDLQDTWDEERRVLRGAANLTSSVGDDVVEAFVAQHGGGSRRPSRRFLGTAAAVLAMIALGAFYAMRLARPDEPERPFVLGPADVRGLFPAGEVESFDAPFRWDLETDGWFVLRVYDGRAEAALGAPPLSQSPRVDASSHEWRWPTEECEGWPERIRWEVQAFDSSGIVLDSAEATARRSSF